ncbi:hypothetical protein [Streptomyces sp. CMB-StM0423]|nr:hypothetical protein [Streptomyces sp. CMB-StM0423]
MLKIPVSRTTWDYFATTSHMGPGDQFSALEYSRRAAAAPPAT